MKKIKKTQAQLAYERERRNLARRIRTIERQGFESNIEIKELASRKYTSNVAANRAALNKMKRLSNEMLKRSSNIQSYTSADTGIRMTASEYEGYIQQKKAEQKEKRRQRTSMEAFSKQLRNIEVKAEEKYRANKYNRDVDLGKAKAKARAKDELFIDNFEKGWKESFEDLQLEGTTIETDLKRFQDAMAWVEKRGFYTKLGILKWADIAVKDLITQVFDSDEPTVKSLNSALLEKFIKHLRQYYNYEE